MKGLQKTLVIITPAFPGKESETSWVPAQQLLVKELKNQFPELNIIVLSLFYPYQKAVYSWNNMKVIAFGGMHKRKLKKLWLFRSAWLQLNRIHRENELIGILSFWCRECALAGSWFAKVNKLKHFCWICGQDARKSNKYVKWVRPEAEELVAISDFLINEFYESHRIRPAHLVPIAIDPKMFPGFPASRDFDIIGAGSFSFQKNFDQFVIMISELKRMFPNIKAVHCGSGEDEEHIKMLVKELDLSENLTLAGFLPHPEVLRVMQHAKILLHPSSYEGFGMVYLEALYAGAHVISFTRAMNHEIKNWHIVKTKEEMISKAAELLQGRETPPERVLVYSIEDTARKMMQLFNQTLNKNQ